MAQYGFHFNGSRCTGCKTCMLACKDYYNLSNEIAFRKVYEYGGGAWQQDAQGAWTCDSFTYYVSISCNHCDNPMCLGKCPQGAISKDGYEPVDAAPPVETNALGVTVFYVENLVPKDTLDVRFTVEDKLPGYTRAIEAYADNPLRESGGRSHDGRPR